MHMGFVSVCQCQNAIKIMAKKRLLLGDVWGLNPLGAVSNLPREKNRYAVFASRISDHVA